MSDLIKPEILRGTRDFLPKDTAKRQYVLDKIKSVFISAGYDAIETPAIEYAKTILGKYGDEGNQLTYKFEDNGGRQIALRYDQTVPFARVVAANWQELPMPFKRYQVAPVWRADRPAKGRYREFYQCDIDIIGTKSLVAEAEIASVVARVFITLGFKKYVIKFNSRRLMNSIMDSLKIEKTDHTAVFRALDKLEKTGKAAVEKELAEVLNVDQINALMKVALLKGSTKEKIAALKEYSTDEITSFLQKCENFGIPEDCLEFDMSLARGLDYYTGIIYEVFLPGVDIGAVCAGGRYDDLCGMFCKEQFSGVGVAFGFDRIIVGMEDTGLLSEVGLNSHVLVTYFDEATLPNSQRITSELQNAGVNTEIYFEPAKMSKQVKYADKKNIPFVLIIGPDEAAKKEVTVKMLRTGKQKTIPQNQIVTYLTNFNY